MNKRTHLHAITLIFRKLDLLGERRLPVCWSQLTETVSQTTISDVGFGSKDIAGKLSALRDAELMQGKNPTRAEDRRP